MYDALGVAVLKNAWEGYNSTLFAYGQTGSGKSWSVVGYGINKGKQIYGNYRYELIKKIYLFKIKAI